MSSPVSVVCECAEHDKTKETSTISNLMAWFPLLDLRFIKLFIISNFISEYLLKLLLRIRCNDEINSINFFKFFYSRLSFCIFEDNPNLLNKGISGQMTFTSLKTSNNKFSVLTDEVLLGQFRESGNMEVLGELYRRYAHLVLGVCLKYLKDQEEAHDATMQIFEKLIMDLKTNRIEHFKSWLYTVSKNFCLMEIRKGASEHRHMEIIRDHSDEKFVEIWEELHLNDVDNEKRLAALSQAITQLNQEQRTCVQLIYLENKSYKEIADLTGMDINHIKSHIQNGKRNLKILLESTR